jgi:hypothetical protein
MKLRWRERLAALKPLRPPRAPTSIALVAGAAGVDTGIRLSTSDAAADHAELLARGVDADADLLRMGPGVPPMFTFRDPDGNRLYVVERPAS